MISNVTVTMNMDGKGRYFGGGAAGAVYPTNNSTGRHSSGGGGIGYSINDAQEHTRFGGNGEHGVGGGGAGGTGAPGMGEDVAEGGSGVVMVRYRA
jgi:hypothetical protein